MLAPTGLDTEASLAAPRTVRRAGAQILGCLMLRTGVSSKLTRSSLARCSWKAGFIQTPLLLWMPAQL